jgi:hypothetical protein
MLQNERALFSGLSKSLKVEFTTGTRILYLHVAQGISRLSLKKSGRYIRRK